MSNRLAILELTKLVILSVDMLSNQLRSKDLNIGTVLQVGDAIARIYGRDEMMAGELIEFGMLSRSRPITFEIFLA